MMTVVYADKGGPYTFHVMGPKVITISHRGPHLHTDLVGDSETQCIQALRRQFRHIEVHEYADRLEGYKAILMHLLAKL